MATYERSGTETVVNSPAGIQNAPRITYLNDGRYVVTYVSASGTTSAFDIVARIFNANGTPDSSELIVNAATAGSQTQPDIAALSNGGFVVLWVDGNVTNGDIRARVYDARGVASANDIVVNDPAQSQAASGQTQPAIVGLSGGRFAVTWADNGTPETGLGASASHVRTRVFEATGTPVAGSESQVNVTAPSSQHYPAIATLGTGYVVVFQDDSGVSGSGIDIRAQRFDAAGARIGLEINITSTAATQQIPAVIEVLNGNFVVAWRDDSQTSPDTSGSSIRAAIFSAAGTPIGASFVLNTSTFLNQYDVALARLADGGFVATFADTGSNAGDTTGQAVRSRTFDANGVPTSAERLVNTSTANDQDQSAVAADAAGNYTIVFRNTATGDEGISSQRFEVDSAPTLSGLTSSVTFAENLVNATRQLLDATVVFGDDSGNFAGETFTVSGLLAEDRVAINNQGVGATQIGVSGPNVTYENVVIGTFAGGDGRTLTVTLNAAASTAAVDALIQNLTYANISGAPTASRTLLLQTSDGGGFVGTPVYSELTGAGNPFGAFSSTEVGGTPRPTFVDIDDDGDLDALVGNNGGTITAFTRGADGTFTRATGSANPFNGQVLSDGSSGPVSPTAVDLDGDGDLDLLVGILDPNQGTNILRAFRNDNNSTSFTEMVGGASGANPFAGQLFDDNYLSPASVDLDGDGDRDVVIGQRDGTLRAFRINATGERAVEFAGGASGINPFAGVLAANGFASPGFTDLDGDGDLDLVLGTFGPSLQAFRNNGNGQVFTEMTGGASGANPFAGQTTGVLKAASFVDLDGDGDLDAVVGQYNNMGNGSSLRSFRNTPTAGQPLNVIVTAEDDLPVAVNDAGTTAENASVNLFLLTNDTDPDGGPKALASVNGTAVVNGTVVTLNSGATVSVVDTATGFVTYNPNGVFDATPAAGSGASNTQASDSFGYTLNGGSAATVTVTINGVDSNDTLVGTAGNNTLFGGIGSDTVNVNVVADGLDTVDLGDGLDVVNVSGVAGQVRLTFRSASVGDGNASDLNAATNPNGDGGLNVRLQAEGANDTLTGAVSRYDDEGITFVAVSGQTFDVRDTGGAQRGDQFNLVALGTAASETIAPGAVISNYYVNAGLGNDVVNGAGGQDFLVGGGGDDQLNGNSGDDTLLGGADIDTAIYLSAVTVASIVTVADFDPSVDGNQAGYTVTTDIEGTDVLSGVEIVDGAGAGRILLVGSSGFADFAAAQAVAVDGDLILVAGPSAAAATEDTTLTLTTAAFGFVPKGTTTTVSVLIDTLPVSGQLLLNGTAVTAGQVITGNAIIAGQLTFAPNANANGTMAVTYRLQENDVNTSVPNMLTFNVAAVVDSPTLTGLGPVTTLDETTEPQLLDADVTFVADTSLAGGSISITGLLAEDRLDIRNQGTGPGQISAGNGQIFFGGVAFATLTSGTTATFNSNATAAAVEALIENLTFATVSDNPAPTRTLSLNITDGTGNDLGAVNLFNERSGSASPVAAIGGNYQPTPAFVDLDGDGDLDLIVGDSGSRGGGTLRAFRNDGPNAPLTELTGVANPFAGTNVGYSAAPAFVDLDGDSDLDAVIGQNDGTLRAFRNNGPSAAFTELLDVANPFAGVDVGDYATPVFVDVEGDGDLDAVVGEINGTLRTFRNNGPSAAFSELTDAANPFAGLRVNYRAAPAVLDVDRDGDLDLVVGDSDGRLNTFANSGGILTAVSAEANPLNNVDVGYWSKPAAVDIDGDGDLDLVVGDFYGSLRVFANDRVIGQPLTVRVTNVDDLPTAIADTASVAENRSIAIAVVANDADADGGPRDVATVNGTALTTGGSIGLASGARVTLNEDSTLTYSTSGRFNYLVSAEQQAATGQGQTSVTETFAYALNGGSATTVTVTVNGVGGAGTFQQGDAGNNNLGGTAEPDFFDLSQGGDDQAAGGAGADVFYFGAALSAGDQVNGGAGADVVALQGNTAVTLGANALVGIETLSLLAGNDGRFGAASATNTYRLTTANENVAAGTQLIVNATTLQFGENLTFDGSAETDGSFFIYGGFGTDVLTGGAGADVFFFGDNRFFSGTDRIVGGGGNDIVVLRGDYFVSLNDDTFTGIETLTLSSASDTRFFGGGERYSYNVFAGEGSLAAGETLTVNGGALREGEQMSFNADSTVEGSFRLFGGADDDNLGGGAGADLIYGGLGGDEMTGNGGADVFQYRAAAEAAVGDEEYIFDFEQGDRIDLSRIDANGTAEGNAEFTFLGTGAFTNQAGQLRVEYDEDAEAFGVQADIDGDGVADMEIFVLTVDNVQPVQADFVL